MAVKIKWSRKAAKNRDAKALKSIAWTAPDGNFADHIQTIIPSLVKRRWIRTVEHSDGDYVLLTEKGRKVLGWPT